MVLETTVICMDNSEWMRNGDQFPTRLDAQHDAVNLLCTARTDSHPENTLGLLTMAGKGVELLASPTEDMKKLMGALSRVTLYGKCDFLTSVQIAQLALKHRKGNVQAKRIVVFIASPIDASEETIVKVGALLKKNNVAVDVVVMGEHDAVHSKMLAFVNAANSSDNSHLISVPPGVSPSDAIITSPLISEFGSGMEGVSSAGAEGGAAPAGVPGGQFAEYGGIDPSLDPELAMVLRASMEEARAHQAAMAAAAASTPAAGEASATPAAGAEASAAAATPGFPDFSGMDDEEALLQTALAMSMQEAASSSAAASTPAAAAVQSLPPLPSPSAATSSAATAEMDIAELDEDEAIQQALLLSMGLPIPPPASTPAAKPAAVPAAPAQAPSTAPAAASATATAAAVPTPPTVPSTFLDDDFVNQLLGSVDVDPNDPAIIAMREQMKPKDDKQDDAKK